MNIKLTQTILAIALVALAIFFGVAFTPLAGLALLSLGSATLNRPRARLCAVTLSVPEILGDVLAAFKTELPEVFGSNGFATDFSSKTAVLGDQIIARVSKVPVSAAYDANNGGFLNGAQDITTVIEDVPVTLGQFRHVPVKISWLTQIATKGVPLYKAAIGNIAFALGKFVIDQVLSSSITSFSNSLFVTPILTTLDTWDDAIRRQCNAQKMAAGGRWAIINSALAASLGLDDRVRSNLFYGARNGEQGIRVWENCAGIGRIREYPDYPASQFGGVVGDRRAVCVAVRRADFSNVAGDLGIPKVMEFYPLKDEQTGLELLGVGWQEKGTGDVYVSAAILFGVGIGNQNSTPGSKTDNAGLLIRTN